MKFYVHVLKSKVNGNLYKGHTAKLEKRILEHNAGKTFSTKAYVPWILVYFETVDSREEAVKREKFLKSGVGREFLKEKLRPCGATE